MGEAFDGDSTCDRSGLTLDDLGDYEYADPGHHGTPKDRAKAFSHGVEDGDPTTCS
jgi:hypothetical protein